MLIGQTAGRDSGGQSPRHSVLVQSVFPSQGPQTSCMIDISLGYPGIWHMKDLVLNPSVDKSGLTRSPQTASLGDCTKSHLFTETGGGPLGVGADLLRWEPPESGSSKEVMVSSV